MECLYCLGSLPSDDDGDGNPFCSPECEESYEEMESTS
jgi:hypothetical protein